jgi:hypothetical protein
LLKVLEQFAALQVDPDLVASTTFLMGLVQESPETEI